MDNSSTWQRAAVDLFEKAAVRLGTDPRQMQESLGWLRRAALIDALRGEAQWLQPAVRTELKRIV